MTEIHITDPTPFDDDSVVEKSLRPSQFDEFIGQKELVDNLKLYIEASNTRGDALDHVLLFKSLRRLFQIVSLCPDINCFIYISSNDRDSYNRPNPVR